MRHKVKGRKFGKERKVRKPFLLSICKGLFEHGSIQTTLERAKEIKSIVEKSITIGKINSPNSRRRLRAIFPEGTVKKIIEKGSLYSRVNGGYARIFKTDKRKTDGAQMAIIEFTDIKNNLSSDVDKRHN